MTGYLPYSQVAFVQFRVRPDDPQANLEQVRTLVNQLDAPAATLVVLPELWAYGFSYPRLGQLAAQTPALLEELQALATDVDIAFAGSLLELHPGQAPPFNTLYLVDRTGILGSYRKQHLFTLWKEDHFFSGGDRPQPVATAAGEVGGLICYDLRFPGLARAHTFAGSRLLVVCAQWPMARLGHWQILLQARAIENQAFVVACNCCGVTGSTEFAGHSMIIAPDGQVLSEAGGGPEARYCGLDEELLVSLRSRFCSVGERPWLTHDADKILPVAALARVLAAIRRQDSQIAFTNGCFDLLHAGHVSYLEHARRTADCLVVGLNSDSSVRALKGKGRPVNSEQTRARVLAALGCVDFVVLFDQETPLELITTLLPDVLVKGADWQEDRIVGAAEVRAAGGRVERIAFEHDVSTTGMIEIIQKQESD